MSHPTRPHFVLIGSGLAGSLLAAYLGRRGYEVDLYEKRPDPRAGNFVGGRSINLALSTRGIHALQQIGLADEVLKHAIPMRGRMIHDRSGKLHFVPYDRDPSKCINSIGRAALNSVAVAAAERFPSVRTHYNHPCVDADLDRPAARLLDPQTGNTVEGQTEITSGLAEGEPIVIQGAFHLKSIVLGESLGEEE